MRNTLLTTTEKAPTQTAAKGLYNPELEKSSCGVGFITRKDGQQSHDVLLKANEALCVIPHRGGMSYEGVGDGAGVNLDLSENFFRKITGNETLKLGDFGVGNFFLPDDQTQHEAATKLIRDSLEAEGLSLITARDVPVNNRAIRPVARAHQLTIRQYVFERGDSHADRDTFEAAIYRALLAIEAEAFSDDALSGLYPLSMSARTQVYKGRFNSGEIIPYFLDLQDPDHHIHTIYFHTRFSTNTAPHPIMAQPFRLMAHNGELNTDKKNRLSENAIAQMKGRTIISPKGQSDSARLDQTLARRVVEDKLDLVKAVVAMMPPAWENDITLTPDVRNMLEYFSLYEEKNDGPAALIFGNGDVVGARLDRLGLRPLRSVETEDYLCVMSEAGQVKFEADSIIRRGRIEAGGMIHFDHKTGKVWTGKETLERLAKEENYGALLEEARITLADVAQSADSNIAPSQDFNLFQRYVACSLNQETFRFFLDPMLQTGGEKISAMGYGTAINALSEDEGGVAKYLSQRFAQVTNPPLDSQKESDGMTLRVALGAKPSFGEKKTTQVVLETPILSQDDIGKLRAQKTVKVTEIDMCYTPIHGDPKANGEEIKSRIAAICEEVLEAVRSNSGIIILTDRAMSAKKSPLPGLLTVTGVNNRLIREGLRFSASLVLETMQIASSHHVAVTLGFGASAVAPLSVFARAEEKFSDDPAAAVQRFIKAANKALMKTMGKVGLCTVESYIGGEFFEPNFLNTEDPDLAQFFPNMVQTVGGVGFMSIASSSAAWHKRATEISEESQIPILGLFKERAEGAGHSYGTAAVRGFVDMTEEKISVTNQPKAPQEETDQQSDSDQAQAQKQAQEQAMRLLTLNGLKDSYGMDANDYKNTGFDVLTPDQIDQFEITDRYKDFSRALAEERKARPAALRDVIGFPADVSFAHVAEDFAKEFLRFDWRGNESFHVRGLDVQSREYGVFVLRLVGVGNTEYRRITELRRSLKMAFGDGISGAEQEKDFVKVTTVPESDAQFFFARVEPTDSTLPLEEVEPASDVCKTFASGAMSHGALVAQAHEAVAHGINMVGGLSNCGEGGESQSRFGTIRASKIKQLASGRFGVWTGYLADPMLEELEIKIAQGAKPGEGGQLPGPKVTVDIAAARGGTPGVELISPPPHHDTYSIEDLAQLIHDAKAARVRVVVKLVSSEGIGTIAVGVAKAGADVINVAGNTGGTGAAAVTSLKNTGRAAEIGIAEVHQALCQNGIREKVILRCSGAHQTASDVVKSALLGADSFEFGTTALMMLKCVMAKNCNIKCPAGLTTNPEVYDGDPRAFAQYLMNVAHEVREILAKLGVFSLGEARGRSDLLHLIKHNRTVGELDLRDMLHRSSVQRVENPVAVEGEFPIDDALWPEVQSDIFAKGLVKTTLGGKGIELSNLHKSVGGQLSIDIERFLNHEATALDQIPAVLFDPNGRAFLDAESITINTFEAAGQSYGAFGVDGLLFRHKGTCNDGVGKGLSGATIAVLSPGGGGAASGENVLIGNFALFGASGGKLFIEGEAGDRFAVRNSGAVAVVEGIGDFGCEYMTNGAVLNIGAFGHGFCNGMSGGFAYQYDPEGLLGKSYSQDSVHLFPLTEDGAEHHRVMVLDLLREHFAKTGSAKAKKLLDDWDTEQSNFKVARPIALTALQDADVIRQQKTRKAMTEEMATALCQHQLRKFKIAFRDNKPVLGGIVPDLEKPGEELYVLLNSYTVQHMAQQLAITKLKGEHAADSPAVKSGLRKLILTEDFGLMQQLMKYARNALNSFSDEQLAVLLSNKRLQDYKTALSRRDVLGMHSFATYGWIMRCDARNRESMSHLPSYEELFAKEATIDIARRAS